MKNFQKNKGLTVENRQKGFSMVELLVGVTIALIATVAIFQVFSVYETQKQQTSSGSDALQNGTLAQYILSNELSNAGQGINTSRLSMGDFSPLYGCRIEDLVSMSTASGSLTLDAFNNKHAATGLSKDKLVVAPLLIRTTNEGSEISTNVKQDAIISLGSSNPAGGLSPIAKIDGVFIHLGYPSRSGSQEFTNEAPLGFCSVSAKKNNNGAADCLETLLVINDNFTKCALTTTRFEKDDTWAELYTGGSMSQRGLLKNNKIRMHKTLSTPANYSNNGYVMNLGAIEIDSVGSTSKMDNRYGRTAYAMFVVGKNEEQVDSTSQTKIQTKNSLLRYDLVRNNLPSFEALADNIVLMKAIYAVSADPTRNVSNRDAISWVKAEGEFSYDQLTADSADARKKLHRIRGIKVALIARNAMPDETEVSTNPIVIFETEGSSVKQSITPSTSEAKKYRYEVFEFVVPLQNAQYGFDQAYASCTKNVELCKTETFTFK